MALKDTWINRTNGVNYVDAEDINNVAKAVIELEKKNDQLGISTVVQTTGDSETAVMSQKATTLVVNKVKGELVEFEKVTMKGVSNVATSGLFTLGGLSTTDGTETESSVAYRSDEFPVSNFEKITFPTGYRCRVYYYENGVFDRVTDVAYDEIKLNGNDDTTFRFTLFNSTVTPFNIEDVIDGIVLECVTSTLKRVIHIESNLDGMMRTVIPMINGFNINLGVGVGNVVDLTPQEVSTYQYAIVNCDEGDKFTINGQGGWSPRLWGFVNGDNILLTVAAEGTTINDNYKLAAPKGAKKLIINNLIASGLVSYRGENIDETVKTLEDTVFATEKIDAPSSDETTMMNLDNIVACLGTNAFKGKTITVASPNKYRTWSFISEVHGKLVCIYSKGESHYENKTFDIRTKISKNGVVWSNERKVIDTENVRDNVTGKGKDSNGDMLVWVRQTSDNPTSFHLYKTSDGEVFTEVSNPTFNGVGHIGDIINVPTIGLMAFYNTYDTTNRSWGIVTSADNGTTWTQTEIENSLTVAECPTEMSGVYVGDGKIFVIGRKEEPMEDWTYPMFQIKSADYGQTWTKQYTNITDCLLSTPSVIFTEDSQKISLYYYHRGSGIMRLREDELSKVWDNPTNWGSSRVIASGSTDINNAGNVNACVFDENHIITFYSGNDTDTGIYVTIK